jgi:hypothetical protein
VGLSPFADGDASPGKDEVVGARKRLRLSLEINLKGLSGRDGEP